MLKVHLPHKLGKHSLTKCTKVLDISRNKRSFFLYYIYILYLSTHNKKIMWTNHILAFQYSTKKKAQHKIETCKILSNDAAFKMISTHKNAINKKEKNETEEISKEISTFNWISFWFYAITWTNASQQRRQTTFSARRMCVCV